MLPDLLCEPLVVVCSLFPPEYVVVIEDELAFAEDFLGQLGVVAAKHMQP